MQESPNSFVKEKSQNHCPIPAFFGEIPILKKKFKKNRKKVLTNKESPSIIYIVAGVMELADVTDSKSVGSDTVPVRVRPPAP